MKQHLTVGSDATWGAPFGRDGLRWVENPRAAGLREVGTASDVCRSNYGPRSRGDGWYMNEYQDETAFGVVFQMQARNGEPVYVAGIRTSNDDKAAAIDLTESFIGKENIVQAALSADGLAERFAEFEREYAAASWAGAEYAHKGEDARRIRTEVRGILRDARTIPGTPTICEALRKHVRRLLSDLDDLRAERGALRDGEGIGRDCYGSFNTCDANLRAAFNDAAGA